MLSAYPVFQDPQGQRYEEPLDIKIIKSLAESVRAYGISGSFTLAQVENLQRYCMTPNDWSGLARAALSPGQYLDFRAFLIDFANEQAAENAVAGNPHWDRDMLLGIGRFANQQTGYPHAVYEQVNKIAIKAWKSIPNRGEVSGNLTKITQGPTEPFSDFAARMVEAAGRIFGDPDRAMPLIEQLVFEQCTKECRAAITPWKSKGLQVWIKQCREIGGPLSNTGLAAAVLQITKGNRGSGNAGACFSCGKMGHMKRQCPQRGRGKEQRQEGPGICPKCRKGKHWANECRSVKDIDGNVLVSGNGGARPKNGQRGPRPQGPQIYGAFESQHQGAHQDQQQGRQSQWPSFRHPRDHGEPLQALQAWTSVPPPDSY